MAAKKSTKAMTVAEVVEMKEALEGMPGSQARLGSYQGLARALGRETVESERFAYVTPPPQREKAPWERADDNVEDFLVNVPFLAQIVEDQRTVLGAMRSHRVPLPEPGDVKAQEYADKLERGISSMWREWGMPVVLSELAWYAVCFGTGIAVLRWDAKSRIPMPSVRSPENFVAQADPDDTTRVQIGVFFTKVLGAMLQRQYPDIDLSALDPEGEYEEIDYYDDTMRYRVVSEIDKPLIEAKHTLGHAPIYLFRSIAIPGSIFGASNLTQTLPVLNEVNRLYSKQAEYIDMVMNAPTFIKDPDDVPPGFTWNKHAIVTMGPQGAIGKAPLASIDPRVFEYRLEDMKRNLDNAMDFTNVSRGELNQEVSGKGVVALKSGTQQRMMMRLQTFDPILERLTEDALLLWQKAGKGPRGIYGQAGGSLFSEIFDPKTDINKDWAHVYVYLDSGAYIDRQAAQVTNLQKVRGKPQAMSVRRFLELDPDCDDVEAEIQRVKMETQEQLQMEQQAMMAMQPPAPDQGAVDYAAQKGGAIEGAPAGAPAVPPGAPLGAAPSAAVPGPEVSAGGEDAIPAVADVFRQVPKVQGEVWLVGEYLEGGITPEEFAEGFIDVYVSEPLDKQTILNSLRVGPLAGAVEQQRLVFHEDEEFLMAHPRLDVSPGTSGYVVEGGEAEMPEEELPMGMEPEEAGGIPPEMAAMMGGP